MSSSSRACNSACRPAARRTPISRFLAPHGARIARKRKFVSNVFLDGEWTSKQIRGPQSFEAWYSSWQVFRASMIMLGEVSPSTLDAYARDIKQLVSIHGPGAWGYHIPGR